MALEMTPTLVDHPGTDDAKKPPFQDAASFHKHCRTYYEYPLYHAWNHLDYLSTGKEPILLRPLGPPSASGRFGAAVGRSASSDRPARRAGRDRTPGVCVRFICQT